MFAVVITVFMGASHSALAFIYDSQKGHKRRDRGWSLWLLLFAIARPCLAHPLLRAGIPSLITGHPPCCRSNVAIKVVWESGAFVQLECSAINRLRTKVINCVTKEADQRQRTGRKEPLLACHIDFIWKAFLPGVVWPPRVCLVAEGCTTLFLTTGRRYWDQCHGRGSFRLQINTGKILSTGSGRSDGFVESVCTPSQFDNTVKVEKKTNPVPTNQLAVHSLPGGPRKETHLCQDFMLHVLFISLSVGFLMLQV